ncbi:hypothetical protein [Photorhabdus australis]|uniref:hypothetical protein n=1 Tax=Photorhabdus australis TaxID=286156 RepID=UPI000566E7CE|nr:hypothetical protein [Photorhabdus australis]
MSEVFKRWRNARCMFNGDFYCIETFSGYFIRKNPETGDVILSCKPHDWAGFFAALKGTTILDDFLNKEEWCQQEQSCDPFEGWKE